MLNGANTKALYESFCAGGATHDGTAHGIGGPAGFVRLVTGLAGLTEDAEGNKVIDPAKRQIVPSCRLLEEMAISLIGPDAYERLGKGRTNGEDSMIPSVLLEDGTSAVMPGSFNNISAWNAAAAGLLEVQVLDSYNRHSFIGSMLAETVPTRLRKQKLIGYGFIGDLAEEMKPGQRHPRVQFPERYVDTPETKKFGLGIDVTREAVFFDPTNGGVITMAETVGRELGLNKERRIISQFIGNTDESSSPNANNRYVYGGVTYDTYQPTTPWINDFANPLVDFDDVDDAMQLFANMVDQEQGEPIIVNGRDVLVMPGNEMRAQMIFKAAEIRLNTQTAAVTTIGPNPLARLGTNLMPASVMVYNMLTRSVANGGLGLSASDAAQYWWIGDFRGAFKYFENWAINSTRVSPSDYEMADQDLIFSMFCNEMGTPATVEPRKVIRNKAS